MHSPAGKRLLGGGAGVWGRALAWVANGVAVKASYPENDTTWRVIARESAPTDEDWHVVAHAFCAAVQ